MNTFKQFISYILVIQLCVSCTGGGSSSSIDTAVSGGGSFITIEGQISQVIREASDLIFPSAVAADGEITVYDMTDPEHPVQIGSSTPVESESKGYSIKVPAEQAVGKIIKLKYKGNIGERDLLISIDDAESKVDGEMNEDKHFEAAILEEQLTLEKDKFEDKEQLKERFKELKKSGVSEDLLIFGDKERMMQVLKNEEFAPEVKKLLIEARLAREAGEIEKESEIATILVNKAKEANNGDYEPKNSLNCFENNAKVFINGVKLYQLTFIGNDLEVLRAFGGARDFGYATTTADANKIINDMRKQLQVISSDNKGKNVSGILVINDASESKELEPEMSCLLKAYKGEIEEPNYLFDLSKLKDIAQNEEIKIEELEGLLNQELASSFEAYIKQLHGIIGEEYPEAIKFVINREQIKADEFVRKILEDKFSPSTPEFDPSFLKDVVFDDFISFEEGSRILEDQFKKTIEDLQAKISLYEKSQGTEAVASDLIESFTEAKVSDFEKMAKEENISVAKTAEVGELVYAEEKIQDPALEQERLAQELYFDRLKELRNYFSKKYEEKFGYPTELFKSVVLDDKNADEAAKILIGFERETIKAFEEKINGEKLDSSASAEALFLFVKRLTSDVDSQIRVFEKSLQPENNFYLDRSLLISYPYPLTLNSEEINNQVQLERARTLDELMQLIKDNNIELGDIPPQQKILSEVILEAKRIEIDICFRGPEASLLKICQDEQESMANLNRIETKAIMEKTLE